jgi:hypothetical protein
LFSLSRPLIKAANAWFFTKPFMNQITVTMPPSPVIKITPASDTVAVVQQPVDIDIFSPAGPPGPPGPIGEGLRIVGTVPTSSDLPVTGNVAGDVWIALDTQHAWCWTRGATWSDCGPLEMGPPGPQGLPGTDGKTPLSNLTAGFTPPAPGNQAQLYLDDAWWCQPGGWLYVVNAYGDGLAVNFKIVAVNGNVVTVTK